MKRKKQTKHSLMKPLVLAMTLAATALPAVPLFVQAATTQPIAVLLDGKPMTMEQAPVMSQDGRVMVPFRAIFEALGATVQWDQAQQLVTATLGQNTITFHVTDTQAQSDLKTFDLLAKPIVLNNHTMVSVRFIAESLGADVTWDGVHRTVLVSSKPLQLVRAIEKGDVAAVKQYLADGNSPKVNLAGTTAIGYALSLHEVDAAKALLDAGGTYASLASSSAPRVPYDRIRFSESEVVLKQFAKTIKANQPDTFASLVDWAVVQDDDARLNALASAGFQVNDVMAQMKKADPTGDFSYTYYSGTMINDNTTQMSDLLQAGLDPQANYSTRATQFMTLQGTLLQMAATMNRADLIPPALQHGAQVNAVDANGWTALMYAAEHGNTASVNALLQGGADPNVTNAKGLTALDIATLHGDADTVSLLMAAGGKTGTNASPAFTDATLNQNTDFAMSAATVLEFSSYEGKTDLVKAMLASASPDEQKAALAFAVDGNNTETVRAILQNGSASDVLFYGTVLNDAATWANAEVVDALLGTVNVSTLSDAQKQMLGSEALTVSTTNSVPVLQAFLKHGVQPLATGGDYGALELCVVNGRIDMLNLMLQNGLSPKDEPGALTLALLNGYDDAALALLKAGADPNYGSDNSAPDALTPLMLAVKASDADLVQALIQAGANVNAKTSDGTSVLAMAQSRENPAVIQALQTAGATN